MSIFFCQRCDQTRDADDGCEELGGNLICLECFDDFMEEAAALPDEPPIHHSDGLPLNAGEGEV